MRASEAIKLLMTEQIGDSEQLELAKHMGAVALSRLRPKPPAMKVDKGFAPEAASSLCCPTCSGPVTNYWARGAKPKHCQFCGQALDWGEEANT